MQQPPVCQRTSATPQSIAAVLGIQFPLSLFVIRQRNRTASGVFNQLLYIAGDNHCMALSACGGLAGGTVLQMDQAAPSYQGIFWYIRECCEDTDMDRNLCLCAGSNNKKAIESGFKSLHNSTDFERKSPAELLTAKTHSRWLELLGFERFNRN